MIRADRRLIFVGGKGGVGKTTIAAALAVTSADAGDHVLAVSVDPAHSLGDALDATIAGEPVDVPGVKGLRAMELDAAFERERWMRAHRDTLTAVLDAGTYLDRADVEQIVDLSPPGLEELAAVLRLMELVDAADIDRIIVDTAPTGHALRLLGAPAAAAGWLASLRALYQRHLAVRQALARGATTEDPVAGRLGDIERGLTRLRDVLHDPAQTACVLVSTPEPVVAAETRDYVAALRARNISLAAIVMNRAGHEQCREVADPDVPMYCLPPVHPDPRGPAALRALLKSAVRPDGDPGAGQLAAPPASIQPAHHLSRLPAYTPPLDRRLYVIAGKGGVGKTTCASALALLLADRGSDTLLQSVDPAGSLAAVWSVTTVGEQAAPAPGADRLWLRQLDVENALTPWRERWEPELAGALMGDRAGGSWAGAAGAPPGADEIVAILDLVDLLDSKRYGAIVLDTAPTGHLLRLLAAPTLARDWAHAAMRILLRHRAVVELGPLGEQLLRVSRDSKRLDELLRDRATTMFVVVAVPDALTCRETPRLVERLRIWDGRARGPELLIVNRAVRGGTLEPDERGCVRDLARDCRPEALVLGAQASEGPRGVDALREVYGAWQLFGAGNERERRG